MKDLLYSVYILKCKDGSLYTGISKNVEERIKTHNQGKGAKYTKSRRPVKLKYFEKGFSHGSAIKREVEIKRMSKSKKVKLIKERRF
jgi:putative endonuclease